jgi:hypothetical protein
VSKKKYIKAANGTLVLESDVEEIRKLNKEIVKLISSRTDNIQIIIESLINTILFYVFNATPRIKLSILRGALTVLYGHWKSKIDESVEDILN